VIFCLKNGEQFHGESELQRRLKKGEQSMKLVTYELGDRLRPGVVEGEYVVDVGEALRVTAKKRSSSSKIMAAVNRLRKAGAPPRDLVELIGRGTGYRIALGQIMRTLAETANTRNAGKGLFTPLASARLRAPIPRPAKITCVGMSYADHCHEQGTEPPTSPIFFLKSVNTICGPGEPIRIPPASTQVDYEAEFAIVIGKAGRNIPEEKAYEHVAGYLILNDVSARDLQFADQQWFRGKSCDTFAPTGPWVVTADEVPDPHNLRISLTLNGQTMQDSNTSQLIFKVPYLVSYLSRSLTWEVGDLISTGTPPGVGVFRKPPIYLKPGDNVSVSVERLGTLTNPVVGPA
jgi:2-keto-4-pentenoate hydratase/2-oxohepta-3-ene-1,7-dioic acid hydratase in catechol pathway